MQLHFKITLEEILTAVKQLTFDEKQQVKKTIDKDFQKNNGKHVRKAGTMKGLITYIAPDFNATPEDFKEYM